MADKQVSLEQQGLEIYQYIVDHCEQDTDQLSELIGKLRSVDTSGQFLASTARYLSALDREKFAPWLSPLIEGAIDRDREHRYIGSLLEAIWGEDYRDRIDSLKESDNNFRRIYKRIYPDSPIWYNLWCIMYNFCCMILNA